MRSLTLINAARFFAAIALCASLAPELSHAVNQAPTVSVTGPASGSQYNAPATVILTATATDPDGTVASVQFLQGTTAVGPALTTPTSGAYTYTWTNVAAGTYSVTAKATDNLGKSTTSAAITVKVITPTTVVTSPPRGAVVQGRTATVNGTFTGPDTTTIYLTAGGGHSTLASSGSGSFSGAVDLSPGPNNIEVQVARPDATYEIVTSPVTAVDPPVTVITGPAASATYPNGTAVTFTADAASAQSTIAKVQFIDGSTVLGEVPSSPYSLSKILSVGSHSIIARAVDAYGFTGDSPPITVSITSAPPTVAITAPSNGATYRSPATISFTATANDPDGQVTSVQYLSGGSVIAQASTTPYASTWSNVPAGNYTIIARATDNSGATGDSAPVNISVGANAAPSVNLTSPAAGLTVKAPGTVALVASARDSDGTISKVEFLQNGVSVATVQTPPYQSSVTGLAAGTYTFAARATDNDGATTTSSGVSVVVNNNALPAVSITSPVNGAAFDAPASVSVAVSASDADGSVTKVDLYDNGTLVASSSSASPTFTLNSITLGSHVLTAKATDDSGATQTSAAVTITVNGITASVTAPQNGATFTGPASFTLAATAATSAGNLTRVDFYDGQTLLQSIATPGVPNANVTLSLNSVAGGTHLYSVKAYDAAGRSAASTAVSVLVMTPPTVAISAPVTGAAYDAPASFNLSASATTTTPGASLVRVDFYQGQTLVGSSTGPAFSVSLANIASGIYSYTARATDSNGLTATSAPCLVFVGVSIALTFPDDGAKIIAPGDVRVTSEVNGISGVAKVDFLSNGVPIGTATTAPYSLVWAGVQTGTYSLTAVVTDSVGNTMSSASKTLNVIDGPTAAVMPGIDGSSVMDSSLSLKGTVDAPDNAAVSVNGVPASTDETGTWVVNGVPLHAGANSISIAVNTVEGTFTAQTITVTQSAAPIFDVSVSGDSGIAPLTSHITVAALVPVQVGRIDFDVNSDGTVDASQTSFNSAITEDVTTQLPGTVPVTIRVYDPNGSLLYTKTVWLQALEPNTVGYRALSALNGAIDKLRLGNAAGALKYFTGDAQQRYQSIFDALGPGLADAASQLGTIKGGTFGPDIAEFVLVRQTPAGNQAFPVYLYRTSDGTWRLESM